MIDWVRRGLHEVRDANDGSLSVTDLEEDDGVDLDGDVVGGDHLLLRDLQRDHAQVDLSQVDPTSSK
jgi:hypothetical protein